MKTTAFFEAGAVESCHIIEAQQRFGEKCGPLEAIDAKQEFSATPSPIVAAIREVRNEMRKHFLTTPNLAACRPASKVITDLMAVEQEPDNPALVAALAKSVAELRKHVPER